jgi:hypothetical protein
MSINRKWAVARAEHIDHDGSLCWIAEVRAGTGTWVIRENEADESLPAGAEGQLPIAIVGAMFPFPEDGGEDMPLTMTPEQRTALGMSDETYQALNVALRLDDERRTNPASDRDVLISIDRLRRRVEALETAGK